MTDTIFPDHLQTLRVGRIVYYSLHLELCDHYSCSKYFCDFYKKDVAACAFCFSVFQNIKLPFQNYVSLITKVRRYIMVYYSNMKQKNRACHLYIPIHARKQSFW